MSTTGQTHDALQKIQQNPLTSHLLESLQEHLEVLGPYEIEVKKTSLHVANGRAFLGIHPRATGLLLNIVTTERLAGSRIRKSEQVSANRWHNELLLTEPLESDVELQAWIHRAYSLTQSG
jgi:hypothetical protein